LADGEAILTGAQAGRRLFGRLIATVAAPTEPEPGYLDFEGVTVATASFLRESVIAFRDYARSTLPNLYPVIANASASVTEELEFFLKHRKDAVWGCRLSPVGEPREAYLLGELDDAHRDTFDLVARMGLATAPGLAAQSQTGLAPTAWNNRLSFLAGRGLLVERRAGKTKTFTPVLEIA
jgi:hypothetical protein